MKNLILKLIIILTTSCITLTANSNAWNYYTNEIKPVKIIKDGKQYIALDLENAKIMQARFELLWHFEKEYENLAAENWLLEGEIEAEKENKTIKDKLKNYGLIGLSVIVLVETLIIILPK